MSCISCVEVFETKFLSNLRSQTQFGNEMDGYNFNYPIYPSNFPAYISNFLKAEVSGGVVEIKWDKQCMEAIAAYYKRGSEVSFSFFEKDVDSPLIDDRPKLDADSPEERSYYAYYIDDDENVGLQSDIITVIVP